MEVKSVFSNIKFSLYERLVRLLNFWVERMISKKSCLELINKSGAKKILIMNSSAFRPGMFKQRSHHFAELLSDGFDLVIYRAPTQRTVKKWKNNIWLSRWIPDVKLGKKEVFYYTTSVNSYPFKKLLKNKKNGYKLIYDYMDEMTEELSYSNDIKLIWDKLDKLKPILCIASSERLYKKLNNHVPDCNNILVKNGVTLQHFSIERRYDNIPADLKPIVDMGKPIVGYYGHIASWIDINLLNKAAKARPEYNFVYIGQDFNSSDESLKFLDNVYYLGKKDYSILPEYGIWFDCATIPFKQGNIARATSPVKLFEYMAMKKPVVCTRDLFECYGYNGVLIAENEQDFINKLDEAIELSSDDVIKNALYKAADSHSWNFGAERIMSCIGLKGSI